MREEGGGLVEFGKYRVKNRMTLPPLPPPPPPSAYQFFHLIPLDVVSKWDHFDILAKGKTDYHCKIKETLYIQELEPAFNVNVGSEKLMLY